MNLGLGKRLDRHLGGLLTGLLSPWARRRTERDPEDAPSSIVLIKLWGLGNVVLLAPVIGALRRRYPGARIRFLSFSRNADVLRRMSELDGVLCLRLDGWLPLLRSLLTVLLRLRRERPDLVIDFEQFCYLSSVLTFLCRPGRSVGFDTPGSRRGRLYTRPIPYRETAHMAHIFAGLARAVGADPEPLCLRPISFSGAEERRALGLLGGDRGGPLVGMHPGSGDNFPGRRWSEEQFAELADTLTRRSGCRVYFTGSSQEEDLVARVRARMRTDALDLCGRTSLGVMAALLRRSTLFVSNDTGPLHVAAAMGVPVVGLFGPNTPVLYGPLSPRSIVLYRELPCSPCISNLNLKESSCRLPLCMLSLRVDEVVQAIDRAGLLTAPAPRWDRAKERRHRPPALGEAS